MYVWPMAEAFYSTAMATSQLPKWIKPQLTHLVEEAPTGDAWLHEVKYDGYRMHARLDGGRAQLLTRTGLDWSAFAEAHICPQDSIWGPSATPHPASANFDSLMATNAM
jgi:ATP-dependent DNA ligase